MNDIRSNAAEKSDFLRRFGWAVVVAVGACLLIAYAFIAFAARPLPDRWSSSLGTATYAQIHAKLGAPQVDMSAKGYQQWVEYHPWGRKVLQVASLDCHPARKPDTILYTVYVQGRYRPVHLEFIWGG